MKKQYLFLILTFLCLFQVAGQSPFTLNLKTFLEGPFTGTQMNNDLRTTGFIPLSQPFNMPPWNYSGTESVAVLPSDVVDWVLVELRETAGDASTAYEDNMVARQAGFILKNGMVVKIDGVGDMQFNLDVNYKLFVVLYHRNHLSVLSGSELVINAGNCFYDFTSAASKAYGGALAQKELLTGTWGLISCDGDANGQVNNADKNNVWKPQSGSSGYKGGDFSLNGQVNNIDKTNYWSKNGGKSAQLPGPWYCGKSIADGRDGQIYNTVQIGTQCWMAENMNIGTMISGSNNQLNNSIIEKYCYNNNINNCEVYGGMYQWDEMMQYINSVGTGGICPEGWHIPTDIEYCTLEQFVDPTIVCDGIFWRGTDGGGRLKESGTVHWNSPNSGASNSSGFTGLPAGYREVDGLFYSMGTYAYFWPSVESGINSISRALYFNNAQIGRSYNGKGYGFSVRCLYNPPNLPPAQPFDPQPENGTINAPINTDVSWISTDPENDPLTYDVYFGTLNPPSLVSTAQSAASYDPGVLDYSMTYFWYVVAHDDHSNTTTGPVWSFTTVAQPVWTCGQPFIDTRDNQTYSSVQIGTQCWMAQNLNVGNMILSSSNMENNSILEKFCYDNIADNCDVYGGLYQWNEMMQYTTQQLTQGICPANWHIPTEGEWVYIANSVGGGMMKTTGTIEAGTGLWHTPNTDATNSSGFNGLPGGYNDGAGNFTSLGYNGYFWSSFEYWWFGAWHRYLAYDSGSLNTSYTMKSSALSVRCIKD